MLDIKRGFVRSSSVSPLRDLMDVKFEKRNIKKQKKRIEKNNFLVVLSKYKPARNSLSVSCFRFYYFENVIIVIEFVITHS